MASGSRWNSYLGILRWCIWGKTEFWKGQIAEGSFVFYTILMDQRRSESVNFMFLYLPKRKIISLFMGTHCGYISLTPQENKLLRHGLLALLFLQEDREACRIYGLTLLTSFTLHHVYLADFLLLSHHQVTFQWLFYGFPEKVFNLVFQDIWLYRA